MSRPVCRGVLRTDSHRENSRQELRGGVGEVVEAGGESYAA